jgi:hypothetical protein
VLQFHKNYIGCFCNKIVSDLIFSFANRYVGPEIYDIGNHFVDFCAENLIFKVVTKIKYSYQIRRKYGRTLTQEPE